jgi:hypothetical protein
MTEIIGLALAMYRFNDGSVVRGSRFVVLGFGGFGVRGFATRIQKSKWINQLDRQTGLVTERHQRSRECLEVVLIDLFDHVAPATIHGVGVSCAPAESLA